MFTQDFYEIPSSVQLDKITQSEYDEKVEACIEACEAEMEEEASCLCSSSCRCLLSASSCSCSTVQLPLNGKDGADYMRHGAFCFSPQQYPDAVNNVSKERERERGRV